MHRIPTSITIITPKGTVRSLLTRWRVHLLSVFVGASLFPTFSPVCVLRDTIRLRRHDTDAPRPRFAYLGTSVLRHIPQCKAILASSLGMLAVGQLCLPPTSCSVPTTLACGRFNHYHFPPFLLLFSQPKPLLPFNNDVPLLMSTSGAVLAARKNMRQSTPLPPPHFPISLLISAFSSPHPSRCLRRQRTRN